MGESREKERGKKEREQHEQHEDWKLKEKQQSIQGHRVNIWGGGTHTAFISQECPQLMEAKNGAKNLGAQIHARN